MQAAPRVAVITPYYKEAEEVLLQCNASVASQSAECMHFLIADGFPAPAFESGSDIRHIKLPVANADNGNTPRGVGTLVALAEDYDFIAYLDADNWFQPNHIESLLKLHADTGAPVLCARRSYHRMDGSPFGFTEDREDQHKHVDTSCFLIHRSCASSLMIWSRIPKPLSPLCDRIFFLKLAQDRFRMAFSDQRTVAFRSQYVSHYMRVGEQPPEGAKGDIFTPSFQYLLTEAGVREAVEALGFYPAPSLIAEM
jgi:glycosyltransferase involved in cell wall biosynthesis